MNRIIEAMNTLHKAGFYVGNLWTEQDVKSKFDCTNGEAQKVLDKALTNEWIVEQIQFAIREIGESMGLTQIADEETGECL